MPADRSSVVFFFHLLKRKYLRPSKLLLPSLECRLQTGSLHPPGSSRREEDGVMTLFLGSPALLYRAARIIQRFVLGPGHYFRLSQNGSIGVRYSVGIRTRKLMMT